MKTLLNAYSDGSFDVKTDRYGWSFVVLDGVGNIVTQECGVGEVKEVVSSRNVAGELSAAMHAALWGAKNNAKIKLHYDYQGVESWVTGEWQAKSPAAQKYKEFMDKFYGNVVTEFVHVKGHSGNAGNKLADKLARQALGKI